MSSVEACKSWIADSVETPNGKIGTAPGGLRTPGLREVNKSGINITSGNEP
mgnify:CR=1 FL=1